MAKSKDKSIDLNKIRNQKYTVRLKKTNAKHYQRKKIVGLRLKTVVYKMFKRLNPIVNIDPSYNSKLQKYKGANLFTKHCLSFDINTSGQDNRNRVLIKEYVAKKD